MKLTCLNNDFVSIERVEHDTRSGDFLVVVEVRRRSFSGRIDTWIVAEALLDFVRQFRRLEETRKGSAIVESISPGELRLEIRAIDSAGHMAVGGLIGYRSSDGEIGLTFTPFQFDPSMLPTLVREAQALVA